MSASQVTLREVSPADLPLLFEHQRDPAANQLAAFPPRDREAFFSHWHERILGSATVCSRAVVVDGRVAGYVASWEAEGRRLVGYWLGREHWGRGVATAALSAFLEHDPARPLHAFVAVTNLASARVLEKCGFRRGERATGPDGVEELAYRLRA